MKNILYLHAGAEMYGADKVMLDLIKGLDKNRFKPYVILPNDGILVDVLRNENITVDIVPYPILRRKYFNVQGLIQYIKDYITYSKILYKIAKKNNISLIHNNTTAVLEGIYLKKKLRVPLIWHVHEIIVSPKIVHHFITGCLNIWATRVIAVSEAVKKHYLASPFMTKKEKIQVIYNGVDAEYYHPMSLSCKKSIRLKYNIPENSIVIGMIGRINAMKGQHSFLEAISHIIDNHSNVYAMLVGGVFEGEEWRITELEEAINNLKTSRIMRLDFQNNTPELYNLFDIFILPSVKPDSLPTVVLESMACGTPVVAYRHGGAKEMIVEGETGLFAEVCNAEDLSKKIEQLINNFSQSILLGKNSRKRIEQSFSLNRYVSDFEKLYDKYSGE